MNNDFPDEQLLAVEDKRAVPWFVDYVNYLVAKVIPPEFSYQQKKRFFAHLKHYYWEEPILYRHCADQVIRRCVPEDEMDSILNHCHTLPCGSIYEAREQQPTYFNQASTGLAYSRMLISSYPLAKNASEWGAFLERTNRPCTQFWKLSCLIYRGWIS